MDSFEINKIIGAILLTTLIVIGLGKFTDFLFQVEKPEQSAYKIEGIEEVGKITASKIDKVEEKVNIQQLLAMGDIEHGHFRGSIDEWVGDYFWSCYILFGDP